MYLKSNVICIEAPGEILARDLVPRVSLSSSLQTPSHVCIAGIPVIATMLCSIGFLSG